MQELFTPQQAELAGYISIGDAIKQGLTPKDRSTLFRQATDGLIPSCRVQKGSRQVVWVLRSSLHLQTPSDQSTQYTVLVSKWKRDMLAGAFAVKKRRLSEAYVQTLEYGLAQYWRRLGCRPSIAGLNVDNFRQVMATFGDDEDTMNDHISSRMHVFKACIRFTSYLIREGLKSKEDLAPYKEEKPYSRYKPKRDWLEDFEVKSVIEFNKRRKKGRAFIDIVTMNLLLHLYAYGGLRLQEAARLKVEDINLSRKIFKIRGKGGKERYVIPLPGLWPDLIAWLESSECPKTGFVIPSGTGKALTKSAITNRFQRLYEVMLMESKSSRLPDNFKRVRPHDLRRAFAIMWANLGMPLPTLQLILGHENIKTTMSYIPINIEHGLKWMEKNLPDSSAMESTVLTQSPKSTSVDILSSFLAN